MFDLFLLASRAVPTSILLTVIFGDWPNGDLSDCFAAAGACCSDVALAMRWQSLDAW